MNGPGREVVVESAVRGIFRAVVLGSLWLLAAGHNQPGGGFVGGLVAGAAIALRYLSGGIAEVRGLTRLKPWTLLGGGLLVSAVTAAVPVLLGRPILDSMGTKVSLPGFGSVWASTAFVFDLGVYVCVVGLVFMVFEAFGEDDDEPSATGREGA